MTREAAKTRLKASAIHCKLTVPACSWRARVGRAVFNTVLSMTTISSDKHSTGEDLAAGRVGARPIQGLRAEGGSVGHGILLTVVDLQLLGLTYDKTDVKLNL